MQQFAGRCAVVTGAASGIGLAMAHRFATEGMDVVLADVEPEALTRAAAEVSRSGAAVLAVPVDVSDPDAVAALAAATCDRFGAVHIVCNNAGVSRSLGAAWEQSLDDWTWLVSVNLWGAVHIFRAFVPIMLAGGDEGHLVTTSSVGGLVANGRAPSYGATKAAVIALAESVADALAERGAPIGTTILCPGGVRTNIHTSERNRPAELAEEGPVREEVAAAVAARARPDRTDVVEPEFIADLVLEAIRTDRRYLLPMQPTYKAAVRSRLAALEDALSASPDTGL